MQENEIKMQVTKRKILTAPISLEVHLCNKELNTGEPYLITKNISIFPAIIVLAHIDSFPATLRVEASYDVMAEFFYGATNHYVATSFYKEKEILLAVFSIINEAYLSYTEELIMMAKPDDDEND